MVNERVNLGLEFERSLVTDRQVNQPGRLHAAVGPSAQWPSDRLHLPFAALWGTTASASRREGFVLLGLEFGDGFAAGKDHQKVEPISLRGR